MFHVEQNVKVMLKWGEMFGGLEKKSYLCTDKRKH